MSCAATRAPYIYIIMVLASASMAAAAAPAELVVPKSVQAAPLQGQCRVGSVSLGCAGYTFSASVEQGRVKELDGSLAFPAAATTLH
jgi:hypothetical protein